VLRELHWLPIRERVKFKLACLQVSPVAVRAVACLPGRWLSPRLGQHMLLSAVSRCPDVRCTTNLQQLWRQNLCSCWTSVVELTTSPAAQSRHQLRTVQTTAEGSSLRERWTRRSVTFDMQRHRKTFYLLTFFCSLPCIGKGAISVAFVRPSVRPSRT